MTKLNKNGHFIKNNLEPIGMLTKSCYITKRADNYVKLFCNHEKIFVIPDKPY